MRFSCTGWLLLKLDSKLLSYGSISKCFTKKCKTSPYYLERSGRHSIFAYEREGNTLGSTRPKTQGPIVSYSHQLDPMAQGYHSGLRDIPNEIIMGSLLTTLYFG